MMFIFDIKEFNKIGKSLKKTKEEMKKLKGSIHFFLLLSQTLTTWCPQHLTRDGYNILKTPAINHNLHVLTDEDDEN